MKNRNGSYKKILIDAQTLAAHGDYLRINIDALKKSQLSPCDFTTLYLLLFLRIKHPKNWLQPKSSAPKNQNSTIKKELLSIIPESFLLNEWETQKLEGLDAIDLFSSFHLKAVPLSINRTMLNWYHGLWSIESLEFIPSPRQLLKLQVKNTRCITLITDPSSIASLVLESRDPLSFLLHDLMHADQFFSQVESLKGQLGFYKLLNNIYDRSELKSLLKNDEHFKKEFEYVASDMNAYVIHLFKCLKSSIYRTEPKSGADDFFHLLLNWWEMNDEQKKSSHLLNSPDFNLENELVLKSFFEAHQEIIQ